MSDAGSIWRLPNGRRVTAEEMSVTELTDFLNQAIKAGHAHFEQEAIRRYTPRPYDSLEQRRCLEDQRLAFLACHLTPAGIATYLGRHPRFGPLLQEARVRQLAEQAIAKARISSRAALS